mgnify:CR=1 FL=1
MKAGIPRLLVVYPNPSTRWRLFDLVAAQFHKVRDPRPCFRSSNEYPPNPKRSYRFDFSDVFGRPNNIRAIYLIILLHTFTEVVIDIGLFLGLVEKQ